ncbi:addiction module antitoxin [Sphingomonas sp. LH128]|uniref:type II toxin-antitoxin system RelE/ParE family toxin n=1 Tax=Sphingomonas sp. LH128 TaxID=473781 RepID=UPI00027CB84C|nr:type II toxin-antitoxin system RelE/ParE family toxin [Sphingomonas sp. LH128]EJU14433.1 addiction module antitoxin [Sphingomonas sp. LH128]
MKLDWSQRAAADRLAVFIWIADDDPRTAALVDGRIEDAVQQLVDFPHSGRPGRVEGTRELVISGTPYLIPYKVTGDTVRLLRLLHGARMWPHDLG